jgi:glutamyl/glutaminyl-tRNA synthetase
MTPIDPASPPAAPADSTRDADSAPAPDPGASVRVRIAPSPTGYMHVGTARTALFNWLFAHQNGGRMILRVEDTDRARFVPGALEDLLAGLEWLGMAPDEGPGIGGEVGPYLQNERLAIYRRHADRLLAAGHAYRCFCSSERLREVREARQSSGQKQGYDRLCRALDPAESAGRAEAGEPHVIRLAMPLEGSLTFRDLLRGSITFDVAEIEDVVLVKTDG